MASVVVSPRGVALAQQGAHLGERLARETTARPPPPMRGEKYGVSLELELAQPHASTPIPNLASAFVGEIAAVLHLIETHDVVSMLERALDAPDRAAALPNLTLPPFTIYTVDAARLDELPFPAPRKIAYFYAQIASIQDDLARLAAEPVPRKARPAAGSGAYAPCSPNSMTLSRSATIFCASCARFSRRSIKRR